MPGELQVFQIMPLTKENPRPISRILSSETETNDRGMGGAEDENPWRIPGFPGYAFILSSETETTDRQIE